MTDLFAEQVRIEEECRNAAIRRFLDSISDGEFTGTLPGSFLLERVAPIPIQDSHGA